MNKYLLVFMSAVLTTQVCSTPLNVPQPRNIEDDANEQIESLRSLVTAAIFEGHINLENLIFDATANRDNSYTDAEISLDTEYTSIIDKLDTIKEYFGNAGANMTYCLQYREEVVLRLPARCRDDIKVCLEPLNQDLLDIKDNTNYTVDIIATEVDAYEFQVRQCGGQLLCLTSLISQIALAEERIPAKVQIEIDRASTQIEDVQVPIHECMDISVAYMIENGNGIVDYIGECLEDYLPDSSLKGLRKVLIIKH